VAALDKPADLQMRAHWAEARAVLDQTEARLGAAEMDDLRLRIDRARGNLELVDRLDGARMEQATFVDGKSSPAAADRAYAKAFRDAGLGQEGDDVPALAERIRSSPVRAHLVAAIDDWAWLTPDPARRDLLLAVARQADPDPRLWFTKNARFVIDTMPTWLDEALQASGPRCPAAPRANPHPSSRSRYRRASTTAGRQPNHR